MCFPLFFLFIILFNLIQIKTSSLLGFHYLVHLTSSQCILPHLFHCKSTKYAEFFSGKTRKLYIIVLVQSYCTLSFLTVDMSYIPQKCFKWFLTRQSSLPFIINNKVEFFYESGQVMNIEELLNLIGVGGGAELSCFNFSQILDATDNLSWRNLVGNGGFGYIYKVVLS